MGPDRFLISRPAAVLGQTQFVKVFEGENARIMAIAKRRANGVMPDGPEAQNGHVLLVQLQDGLIRAVTLHFRRG